MIRVLGFLAWLRRPSAEAVEVLRVEMRIVNVFTPAPPPAQVPLPAGGWEQAWPRQAAGALAGALEPGEQPTWLALTTRTPDGDYVAYGIAPGGIAAERTLLAADGSGYRHVEVPGTAQLAEELLEDD